MYAFFFATGITFKVKPEEKFFIVLLKNIKRLYIPYLFFAFMWDITNIVIQVTHGNSVDFSASSIIRNILAVLIGRGIITSNASIGPAWFLLCLLFVRTVFWGIVRLTNNNKVFQFIICILLFILGYLLRGYECMPLYIIQSLTTFIFVFLGYSLKDFFCNKAISIQPLFLVLLSLLFILVGFILSKISNCKLLLLNNILPDNVFVLLGGAICGILAIFGISNLLSKVKYINTILTWCGINSMIIMGIHSEIKTVLNFMLSSIDLPIGLIIASKTLLIMLISVPVSQLLKKVIPLFA